MNRHLLFLALAAIPSYDLKMDLAIDGKTVSQPHIVIKEGEKAFITHGSAREQGYIEVLATKQNAPDGSDGIRMTFWIGQVASDGSRTVVSQPQILARPNEEAQIEVNAAGKPVFSVKVTAKPVNK